MKRTSQVSTLEGRVSDAWRAVRWAESQGAAACPTCFDGADLKAQPADLRNVTLHKYSCAICRRDVSDWSGTWIAPLKAPLVRWAWLCWQLDAAPTLSNIALEKISGLRDETIKSMREKLATAPPGFTDAWLAAMNGRGLTLKQLAAAVTKGEI